MYNIATSGLYCWIGLNDLNAEGTFLWADGNSDSYRNWAVGEPNDQGNEDCALMWVGGYWDDDSCTATRGCYFCSLYGKDVWMSYVM